jgi:hypothetical protein
VEGKNNSNMTLSSHVKKTVENKYCQDNSIPTKIYHPVGCNKRN